LGPPAPTAAGIPAAPVRNRAAYSADGDNSRGDWAHTQQIARQLWHQYGGQFGKGAQAPPLVYDQPMQDPRDAAQTYSVQRFGNDNPMSGGIALSPTLVRALMYPHDPNHDQALRALVHETAHTFQSPATNAAGDPTAEGGAEAFAEKVAPGAVRRAGLANNGGVGRNPIYQSWVKQAQAKGPAWVSHGQFMSPAALRALKLPRGR
jgi:hypothetical protein